MSRSALENAWMHSSQTVRRDLLGRAVGGHPLGQRPGAAEHLVDAGVGGAVALRVARG